jgi:predicted nucleotidyltransferase
MGMNTAVVSGLAGALFSSVQQRVLTLLFSHPDRELSTSDVIRLAKSGTGAVHRELRRLANSGLLKVTIIGNQKRYRANRSSPIFSELHRLILKTAGLIEPLKNALSKYEDRIGTAFVYGSVARGEDTSYSDIDLLIIGDDLTYADIYAQLQETEKVLGRTINPTLMAPGDWDRKIESRNGFASRVHAQPKLFVIGADDDLGRAG